MSLVSTQDTVIFNKNRHTGHKIKLGDLGIFILIFHEFAEAARAPHSASMTTITVKDTRHEQCGRAHVSSLNVFLKRRQNQNPFIQSVQQNTFIQFVQIVIVMCAGRLCRWRLFVLPERTGVTGASSTTPFICQKHFGLLSAKPPNYINVYFFIYPIILLDVF